MADKTNSSFNWQNAINETYQDVFNSLVNFAPELIGAIALLITGWLVAHLLRMLTKKTVLGFDSLFKKVTKSNHTHNEQIKHSYTVIISQVVFWAVILFFIAASANLLGWKMFAGWMDGIISYLPKIITGLLIILGGYLLSSAIRSAILSAGSNAKITQTPSLARLAQVVILSITIVIGLEQAGLNLQFLTTELIVLTAILLGGACLAFGLGAKTMVANTIGAQYTRKHCNIGDFMKLDGVEGEILEVRQTCIILETADGRAIIPAKLFHEQVCLLSTPEDKNKSQASASSEEKAGNS